MSGWEQFKTRILKIDNVKVLAIFSLNDLDLQTI